MPLFHGKKSSNHEMHEGKGHAHSLALAYGMKHRQKKAQGGGMCAHGGDESCPHCMAKGGETGVHVAGQYGPGRSPAGSYAGAHKILKNKDKEHAGWAKGFAKEEHERVLGEMRSDKGDRRNMAEGGMMHAEDEYDSSDYNKMHPAHYDEAAMEEDDRKLGEHGEIEEGPQGTWMAEGGQITGNYSDTEDGDGTDMVGRIMSQRQRMFSKGGQVSNDDEMEADFSPNEFDELHLDDKLEQHDTGENSGDYDGNEGEDERREDIVSRIMRSRRKGPGHNPRPA